jgi:hypothetical protein
MAFDWRPLLSGGSDLLTLYLNQKASGRAQQDLLAGQTAAMQKQAGADQAIGNVVQGVATDSAQPAATRSLADYTKALQKTRTAPGASMPGNVGGKRYAAAKGAADVANQRYAGSQAFDLSQIDAPTRLREQEGYQRADLAQNLDTTARGMDTDLYLARLKAAREQASPWAILAAQLANQVGRNWVKPGERLDRSQMMPAGAGVRLPAATTDYSRVPSAFGPGSGVRLP